MAGVVSWDGVLDDNPKLIRKALSGAFFIKKWDKADTAVTQVWTTAAGFIVPTGYKHVGRVTQKDGYAFSRDTDTAEVDSHGYSEPSRIDFTKDQLSLKVIMQESKAITMGLYDGVDLSAIVPDADGNLVYDKPARPQLIDYRGLVIGVDGDGASMVVFARWLPLIRVTKLEDETWGSEDELQRGVTVSAFTDPTFKTSVRNIWAGPGLDAAAMGFVAGS